MKLRIGLRVKHARQAKGLTQAQLAEALDKSVETISNIERGAALTGLETLEHVCGVLDKKLAYFFEGVEDGRGVPIGRLQTEEALIAVARDLRDRELRLALAVVTAIAETK